jgi:hypothetical protein
MGSIRKERQFIITKRVRLFTECGEWFLYIGNKHGIRFSSAGFLSW